MRLITLSEIKTLLDLTGYPVAYHHFNKPVEPPFVVYLVPYYRNFSADDKVFKKIRHIQIELYTANKDELAEKVLENTLDNADSFYNKTENYISNENLYQIIYELEVL